MIETCESCGKPAVLVPVEVALEGPVPGEREVFAVCATCAGLASARAA